MKNKIKIKKIKKFFNWFFSNTDNTEENLKQFGSLYGLVEQLQYRIEDLESEVMLLNKENRKILNALDERIDILNRECKNSCTKN